MLNEFQSSAARALPCWICIAAPLWLIVACPPTTRPPVGNAKLEIDCARLSNAAALSASATAAARIRFLGTTPPRLVQHAGPQLRTRRPYPGLRLLPSSERKDTSRERSKGTQ